MPSVTDRVTAERLRETIELLESIAADRSVLAGVPDEERKRLLQAVANVYSPDRVERRRMSKIVDRQRKAARVKGDQGVLQETGIRSLRRKPVFHTPNVFPTVSIADGFTPDDVQAESPRAQSREPRASALLRLQAEVLRHPSLLRSAVFVMRRAELHQAHRVGGPHRSCRAADRRAREDWLSGRVEAPALRRSPDCHHPLPARLGEPLRARAGLRRLGSSPRGLRPRPAAHAERRSLLPRVAGDQAPPRLHRQQRVSDGAASAGFLRPHDGGRDGRTARHAGARAQAARVVRGTARIPSAAGE